MQDKGSITETAQLPRFNGPVLPTINAAGGLVVQVPISEKDANKAELRDEILKLANQPGNAYLKELVNRKDVDWQQVLLTQKDWDYKSQGLTAAGAAIIVIIVTIVTMGSGTAAAAGAAGGAAASGTTVGLGASMLGAAGVTTTAAGAIVPSALGAMANAAVTSLAAQASVSLINNGGDIGKTLKDLGSKDAAKNLAASVVTAGLMSQVSSALNLKPDSTVLSDRLVNNFTSSVGSTLVQTAIKGGDLEENLKVALLSGLAGALQGQMAENIKGLEDINYIAHKLAHALTGCIAGAIQGQCQAGAIGGAVGEIVASFYDRQPTGVNIEELKKLKDKIEITSQLVSGVIAAYTGNDVNIAANSALIAVENNSNSEILLEIQNQEEFLSDLSPTERHEWEQEFQKADLKLGELALFISNFIPAGNRAKEVGRGGISLFKQWIANRKIIRTFNKEGISYRVNLPEHIAKFEKFNKTTVSGAHNKLEFEALQNTKDVKILSTKATSTKGVYEIEYQIPAYHPQKPGVITGYKRSEIKTVYDPKVYSDAKIVEMSQKASALGFKDAVSAYQKTGGTARQYTTEYGGLKFRSYLEKNGNGQIYISNVHIIK